MFSTLQSIIITDYKISRVRNDVGDLFSDSIIFLLGQLDYFKMLLYLTVSIFGPVEPACERRAHPGEGPGKGPEGPIRERLCQGDVREPMWEGPTVPGILDGDIHDEISGEMKNNE